MKTKWPPGWIYYASTDYISGKTQRSALIKAFYGLLMMAMLVGPLMGVQDPRKIRNRRVAKSQIVFIPILILLVKKLVS